jgi:hypothetical protein
MAAKVGLFTCSVKKLGKREMPDVSICDDAIASAMAEKQRGANGVSQLTPFLPQQVNEAAK